MTCLTIVFFQRTNRSYFSHETTKDDFDAELPSPDRLVPPAPGWKLTPVGTRSDVPEFPTTVSLATTKLAAVHCEDGSIHVFYQAKDESIRQLVFILGKGWISPDTAANAAVILEPGVAKAGTPLTAVAGGWSERRVFAVDKANKLLEVYSNNKDEWVVGKPTYLHDLLEPHHRKLKLNLSSSHAIHTPPIRHDLGRRQQLRLGPL